MQQKKIEIDRKDRKYMKVGKKKFKSSTFKLNQPCF